jgi:hypothetical protein
MIAEKIKAIEEELANTVKAMQVVKDQIRVYNKKGEELAAHATYLNGRLDALKELQEAERAD